MADKKVVERKKELIEQANHVLKPHQSVGVTKYANGQSNIVTDVTRPVSFAVLDFTGKKTKIIKMLYEKGRTTTIKIGTLWEEIPAQLRNKMSWKKEDFVN
jgi:hypothetical protein